MKNRCWSPPANSRPPLVPTCTTHRQYVAIRDQNPRWCWYPNCSGCTSVWNTEQCVSKEATYLISQASPSPVRPKGCATRLLSLKTVPCDVPREGPKGRASVVTLRGMCDLKFPHRARVSNASRTSPQRRRPCRTEPPHAPRCRSRLV